MRPLVAEMHETAVHAWAENGWICIRLGDDREIRFPAVKNRRLKDATPTQLSNIELICGGSGLHWPELDEDLSVQGIVEGRLGLA